MKELKIISKIELDIFIGYQLAADLDTTKTDLLTEMGILSIYSVSVTRGKNYYSPMISERIIKFAKTKGYEFK